MGEAKVIHVGFTGTQRKVEDARLNSLMAKLESLRDEYDTVILHHGDCIGMDAWAHMTADALKLDIDIHPPADAKKRAFCQKRFAETVTRNLPKAYLDRNRDIVDAADILIAMPRDPKKEENRSGTWATVRYARKTKTPVIFI